MTGDTYGFQATDPDDIEIEAGMTGGDVTPKRPAVLVTDPYDPDDPELPSGADNHFAWSPGAARQRARAVREHSDSRRSLGVAERLEDAATVAEAMAGSVGADR